LPLHHLGQNIDDLADEAVLVLQQGDGEAHAGILGKASMYAFC
jgi:hypothetical protein